MTKYIFTTGGVLSSVGKGTVTASVGKILQVRGFSVSAVKIDPYLNCDAGTMNPYQHGEVYVTEDGGEMDLDLGTYERFLDINLSRENNITTGQIYLTVIERERKGEYLGQCVQIIPHITTEIKRRIKEAAKRAGVEILLVEVGGTVGDIEGLPFLEAIRQMRLEEGYMNTLFIHVALVPYLEATGEYKTKPVQHSVQELRRIGIQPDIIVARAREAISGEPRRKIALFGSVDDRAVFFSPNVESIYQLPLVLDEQGLGDFICERLGLPKRKPDWSSWEAIANSMTKGDQVVRIAMCGKYAKLADSYLSVNEALKHAAAYCGAKVEISWLETEKFEQDPSSLKKLLEYDGVLVPGGFGSRGAEGKIMAIEFARKNDIPFLGICFGFQLAIVEFARNAVGLEKANSTEVDPDTPHPVVDLLPEQRGISELGGTMRLGAEPVLVMPNTLAYTLYGREVIYERHRHRYEVSPEYREAIESKGMVFSGLCVRGVRAEILELPDRYFFFATQYHPEFKSRPGKPDPAFYGFIKAALCKKAGEPKPDFSDPPRDYAAAYTAFGRRAQKR